MADFWLSVLSSFVGGYALALFGVSKNWIPFKNFIDTGVVRIFRDQKHAIPSLLCDIEKSRKLYLLAMKGGSFSNPEKPLSRALFNTGIEQKFLISALDNPYLVKRGSELKMDMKQSVRLSADNFKNARMKNSNIKLQRHKEVVRFRIILLSDYLYLSFQEVNVPGKLSPILKIRNTSVMYKNFSSLFDDLWEKYCCEDNGDALKI